MRRASLVALCLAAAGCGAANIKGSTAEQQIKATNGAFKKVDCPDNISASQGATFTCTAKTAKGTFTLTVQVDSVDNGNARLSLVKTAKQVH